MLKFQAAADEYIGWLQLDANRSPNTVRAYQGELRRLAGFLASRGHSLRMEDLGHEDLRAYQRHLAGTQKSPASRARALVAIRSWLRWLARENLIEADRTNVPRQGNRLIVTGKGAKQRAVYLTEGAKEAVDDYLQSRTDTSMALFVNYDRAGAEKDRRLTAAGARHLVRKLRRELGAWAFRSPHVARHTTATSLLEVTGGDVRLVQEVLGHANLNTLQGYTKIVDSRKQEAYRRYQEFLDGKKNA